MINSLKNRAIILLLIFSMVWCSSISGQTIKREFRGVWIATVNNIDWPSKKGLSTDEQKKELIELLDFFKSLNFNAVIFQVRPAADAFYNSKYEPWSAWLTDSLNNKPRPYYDPLAFVIKEAHNRGMEFHAWLNPYRAMVNYKNTTTKKQPLIPAKPKWFLNYGEHIYFNPGVPEVRKYTTKVVANLVQEYDIDAIHFDDYFYPYKINDIEFPDGETFKKYGGNFYPNRLEDWRRDNVNKIILELRTTIKSIKPWVQFGISPFGVWRNKADDPKGSETQAGQTNYDHLYADVRYWLQQGWLDYIVPQAYWHIGFDLADYHEIVNWWSKNNFNTNLYIGQAMYRQAQAETKAWNSQKPTETEKQLNFNKKFKNVNGCVFFSAKSFKENRFNINNILKEKYYSTPALPPSVDKNAFFRPQQVTHLKLKRKKGKIFRLSWQTMPENTSNEAVRFLVYQFNKDESININNSSNIIALTGKNSLDIHKKTFRRRSSFVVVPVSRNNNVGEVNVFVY